MEKTNLVIPANSSPNSDNLELISIIPWDKSDSSQGQITIYRDLTKSAPTFLVGSSERIVEEERNKTIVIEAVKIGVSEGKKSYANLDITQEAATYDYVLELYSDIEDNTIPSTGGSCNITAALVTYRNGRKVSTIKVNPQLSGSSTGFKLVGNVVTAENRNMVIGPDRYIVISGYTDETVTGDTVVGTIRIKQQRNIIESVDFNDTLLYDKDIPASGGSINPIITVDRTYTYTTGNTINNHIPDSEYIESKSETIEFTTTREPIDPFTLDENTGTVSAPSRGTVKGPRLELPVSMNYSLNIKYTFDENPISFEDSVSDSAYQAENGMVYSDIEAYGSTEEVPASGGTVSEALKVIYKQIASFSSGEVEEITSGAEITYEPVEIPSKGTKISNLDKRGVLPTTISLNGKSVTIDIDIYQKGNYVTDLHVTPAEFRYDNISAKATSSGNPIVIDGTNVREFTFSSGEVSNDFSVIEHGNYAAFITYSLSEYINGFTAIDPKTGVLTATNRGTEIGDSRTSGVVIRTIEATWTPEEGYDQEGIKSSTNSTTATCTQAENKVESYGTPTGRTLSVSDIPASGGTVSSGTLGGTITQTITFSSGASDTITNPTVTSSSYSAGVSNGSLGTTVVPRTKIGTLTYSYICNGKTGSVSADVYQQANIRYDKRTVLHFDNFEGPASKTVSAAGGQVHLSLELVRGFTSGAEGDSVDVTIDALSSYSVSGTGFSISSSDKGLVLVANRGTTVGSERNGTVTGTWNGLTSPAIVCTQEANIIESEIIEVDSFVYSKTIPYTGGTSTPSISVDSIKTYSSEATSRSDVTNYTKVFSSSNLPDGFSLNSSTGVVTGENYTGSTERSASIKVDVSYTNTLGSVVTASKTATVVQEEADMVYSDPVITLTYPEAPASGGTLTPTISVTQTWGYGQTTGGGSNTYNINTLPAGSYKITGTGVTPTDKGVVTISSLGTTIKPRTKVGSTSISVTLNGKTSSKSADIYQVENQVESIKIGGNSGDSTIFTTPKVDVACGENEWWQYSCWATYSSNATKSILASDFTLTSNQSWATVSTGNANWLKRVDFASRGTTPGEVRSVTLTANYSGKSATVSVAQEANSATYGGVTINGGSVSVIPASGGTVSSMSGISASQTVTFTSGSSRAGSVKITYSNAVTASSKGTSISNQTTAGTLTATATGEGSKTATKALTVYQAGNYVTAIKGSLGTFSYPTISAGATSATPNLSAGFGVLFTFSSGSTSSSTPAATYGSLSVPSSFKLSASQNGFTAVNSSTGVLTATNRGTTVGAARTSGTVTRTLTATWTPTSSYNAVGTKTNSWNTTATCTQEANNETSITYGVPVVSLSVSDIPAAGGTVSSGTVTYTQTRVQNYTSGGTKGLSNVTSGGSISYSTAVSASSKGTTISSRTKVGTLTATVTLNGQKGSDSADVYQAANSFTDHRLVVHFDSITGPTSKSVSPAGATVTLVVECFRLYSSGSREGGYNVTDGSTITVSGTGFSINSSKQLVAANRGTEIGAARNGTIVAKYSSLTSPGVTCTQQLNKVIAVNIGTQAATQYPSGDIPASGGTKTPQAVSSSSYAYSSGVNGTIFDYKVSREYSMPNTSGFSLNTSNGVVTGADRTTVTGARRSATITCKFTLSYTNPASVGGNTVSNNKTDTLTIYQQANDVSYSGISVPNFSYPSRDIPYQGGSQSPTLSYSQTASYTSGHTKTITTGASLTYAVTGTGFSINSSTGVVTASANTGARRTATVSVTIHLNNKIRSNTTRVYQAAWVKPTINLSMVYNSISGAFTIQASSNVPENIEIMATAYNYNGEGGDSVVTMIKGSNYVNGFLMANMPQYEIVSVDMQSPSPYETTNAIYRW